MKAQFFKSDSTRDGLTVWCRSCMIRTKKNLGASKNIKEKVANAKARFPDEDIKHWPIQSLDENVIRLYVESPELTTNEIAARFQVEPKKIYSIIHSAKNVPLILELSAQRISTSVPVAVKSLLESNSSPSPEVKFKAAVKILESERILGPERMVVTVNDISKRSNEDLRAILSNAKPVMAEQVMPVENELG